MFFDSNDWPPAPSGFEPERPRPVSAAQERLIMRVIGVLLLTVFLGPFAGSSVINALVALFRSAG